MTLDGTWHQMPRKAGPARMREGEAQALPVGDEVRSGRHEPNDTGSQSLLHAALASENVARAWRRVKANKGSAGVDGRSIADTAVYLKTHWTEIRQQLLDGTYRPAPVRRVQLPKPDGSMRDLGIPTVTDRLIQQALLQALQPLIDPSFSDHSYGFRPGRRAHDAVRRAQGHVREGHTVVVDVDLEKFFDRVNHDVLIDRLSKRIADTSVLRLIRRYLKAGVLANGVVQERFDGTPQGGPLSPLLANVLLDEVDKALEKRGHRFVRYADDCNVYVRSRRAGERVMAGLRTLYGTLKLRVNELKSAVASVYRRQFLGFSLFGAAKLRVADKALHGYKRRIRQLTRRSGGRSIDQVVAGLRVYVRGWKGYFQLSQTPRVFANLDKWLRHRLRALHLKQWKRGKTIYAALRGLGASHSDADLVARNARCWWANSAKRLNRALPIAYFDALGVPRLA